MKKMLLSAIFMIATLFTTKAQTTFYIDGDATAGGNGLSWATAFQTLQSAIDAASGTTTYNIFMKAGTYKQITNITAHNFNIYGGFNGTETWHNQANPTTNPTIFDGDINDDDVFGVWGSGLNDNLQSLWVFQGGSAYTVNVNGITFKGAYRPNTWGNGSAVIIRNNNIHVTFTNCRFKENSSGGATGGGAVNIEAGVFGSNITTIFDKCLFDSNTNRGASSRGSAVLVYTAGGGIASAQFTNCVFKNNLCFSSGNPAVIYQASSSSNNGNGSITLNAYNNTFVGNNSHGVFAWNGHADPQLTANFHNNLLYNNGSYESFIPGNSATSAHPYNISCFNNYWAHPVSDQFVTVSQGSNITGSTPEFTDAVGGDYSLTSISPCIDLGGGFVSLPDAFDYAGNPRTFNGIIDIGAFEYNDGSMNNCDITNVDVNNVSACDPVSNTYSVDLTVFYDSPPSTGMLSVNNQDFTITSSPQSLTLTNLPSDGIGVSLEVVFTANSSCDYGLASQAWQAPESCLSTSGLEETTLAQIQIFPNPASNFIYVQMEKPEGFKIYSISGQAMGAFESSPQQKVNISALSNGMYFLQTESGQIVKFTK